jgi:hypothetical protein
MKKYPELDMGTHVLVFVLKDLKRLKRNYFKGQKLFIVDKIILSTDFQ